YCAIPSIRGRMRSVPIEELVREAQSMAQEGDRQFRELVVIAQDTANYGLDIYGRKALPELLERLAALPQYRWIRVMYMHPDHFDPAWLTLWQEHPKLLPYYEIPVQHSEEHILKAMNRKRKGDELVDMLDTILREVPGAVLRTTLISGFPGETRWDALALRKFIGRVPFLHLGVFLYSPEEGTPAAGMPAQVSPATAQRRANKLLQAQQRLARELLEAYVGRTVDVLIEERSDEGDDVYLGRAWFQAPEIDGVTIVNGKGIQPGEIRPVLITDVIDADLFGEVI
ncbi:MAG: radical SAM protein, partial [Candidatus Syntrophosphaera sp.]